MAAHVLLVFMMLNGRFELTMHDFDSLAACEVAANRVIIRVKAVSASRVLTTPSFSAECVAKG